MLRALNKKKQNKKQKRISPNSAAIIGALIILIGGFFLSYNYIQTKKILAYDNMAELLYKEESDEHNAVIEETNEEIEEKGETNSKSEVTNLTQEKYIGYLSIPKINLRKGFFSIDSSQNNVEKNIYIVKGSSYPDVENGNFILAAHSGTGWKAFFNNLYKLDKGDTITITYNDTDYNYKITKIYTQEKTGTIAVYRNYDKTTLTLVTCTNNNSKTQTIYIAELEK